MKTIVIVILMICLPISMLAGEHSPAKIAEAEKLMDVTCTKAQWIKSVKEGILAVRLTPEGKALGDGFYMYFEEMMMTDGYKRMRKEAREAMLDIYSIEDIKALQAFHAKHPHITAKANRYAMRMSMVGADIGRIIGEAAASVRFGGN